MTSTSPDSWWSSQYCRPAARYSVCSSGFSFSMANQQIERCSADSRFSEYFNFAWFLSKLYPSGLGTHASKIMTRCGGKNTWSNSRVSDETGMAGHGMATRVEGGMWWCGWETCFYMQRLCDPYHLARTCGVFPCWMSLQILWSCESTCLRCFETGKDFLPHGASCPLNESNENELKCGQRRTLCIPEKHLKRACRMGRIVPKSKMNRSDHVEALRQHSERLKMELVHRNNEAWGFSERNRV